METFLFFGGGGFLAGLAVAYVIRPSRLIYAALIGLILAVVIGLVGATSGGETAGGWLGAIIAVLQLIGYFVGMACGAGLRVATHRNEKTPLTS